jgi:hypothetical protein
MAPSLPENQNLGDKLTNYSINYRVNGQFFGDRDLSGKDFIVLLDDVHRVSEPGRLLVQSG